MKDKVQFALWREGMMERISNIACLFSERNNGMTEAK